MQAASAGQGPEHGGVLVEFFLGDIGADDLHAVGAVHAEDFAAAAGEVADDIAHAFVGHADFDDADWFEHAGAGGEEGFLEGLFAGDLEGDVLGIDGVHLAVVEVDLEVDDAVSGEDALAGGGHDAFLDGGDKGAVDVLAGEGFGEFDAAVAFLGFDAHPDFGELAGAAGLFFVAVFGFAAAFDGFAIGDFGFDEVEVDAEPGTEAGGDHLEVEFALAGDDGLMELGIDLVEEGLILLVERGEAGGDFVFLALGFEAESGVDIGFGVADFGEGDGVFGVAEGIAGVGVLEFDGGADIAGVEGFGADAVLAIEGVDLAEAFGDLAVAIVEILADVDRARIEPEKGELAELGFAHRFEHIKDRLGMVQGDADGIIVGIERFDFRAVDRGRSIFGDEIHEPGDADVGFSRGAEDGDEGLVLDGLVDAGAHFVFGKAALGEELLEQGIIGFGDVFDELGVELTDLGFVVAGGGFFGVFAGAIGLVSDDFIAHDVEDLVEAGAGIDGDGEGEGAFAEAGADLLEGSVEIGVFFIEAIDDDDLGDAVLGGVFPDLIGADADAVGSIDDDESEVSHPEGAEAFADEIEVTRGIDDIEFLIEPFGMEERGVDGDLPVLFVGVVIGEGGAGGDAAEAVNDAGASEHAFAEHGFAGGGMADDREVADIFGGIRFHRWSKCLHCGAEPMLLNRNN